MRRRNSAADQRGFTRIHADRRFHFSFLIRVHPRKSAAKSFVHAVVERTTTRPPPTSRTVTGAPSGRKPLSLTTEKIWKSAPLGSGNSAEPPGRNGVTARPTAP